MTTGLLGGAFDPPHNGHLALASAAVAHFHLDRLIVLVASLPGHKPVETAIEPRLELAARAFASVGPAEVVRDDHAFTIDLLRDDRFHFGDDAVFLIGADQFSDFLTWKEPDAVLERVRLGVASRPGYERGRLDPVLARLAHPGRVEMFPIPAIPVSSSEVRARVARGEPVGALVPPGVARSIEELGLYRWV